MPPKLEPGSSKASANAAIPSASPPEAAGTETPTGADSTSTSAPVKFLEPDPAKRRRLWSVKIKSSAERKVTTAWTGTKEDAYAEYKRVVGIRHAPVDESQCSAQDLGECPPDKLTPNGRYRQHDPVAIARGSDASKGLVQHTPAGSTLTPTS